MFASLGVIAAALLCAGPNQQLRAQGVFETFDVPGAAHTYAIGINARGTVTGLLISQVSTAL